MNSSDIKFYNGVLGPAVDDDVSTIGGAIDTGSEINAVSNSLFLSQESPELGLTKTRYAAFWIANTHASDDLPGVECWLTGYQVDTYGISAADIALGDPDFPTTTQGVEPTIVGSWIDMFTGSNKLTVGDILHEEAALIWVRISIVPGLEATPDADAGTIEIQSS